MAYCELLIDNPKCSRRFHVTFDDAAKKQPEVELRCPYCAVIVFHAKDHPPVALSRQENLVNTVDLSEHLMHECDFLKQTQADVSIS